MPMIMFKSLGGNQFVKARKLLSPVVVVDPRTFRVPSSSQGERDHKVVLDDPERPSACSCTCEAGLMLKPCWAMARVLDAIEVLRANNIYVSRGAISSRFGLADAASAIEPIPQASIVGDGELALIWGGDPPRAGVLYTISN